jgi:hypothetical protein
MRTIPARRAWFLALVGQDLAPNERWSIGTPTLRVISSHIDHRNISVSHRHSVALLDEHVGPKT